MCPDLPCHRSSKSTIELGKEAVATEQTFVTLVTRVKNPDVVLQTLMVKVLGKEPVTARAIIDTASHKSYIVSSLAEKMELEPVGELQVAHELFGGAVTAPQIHKRYMIRLSDMHGNYSCRFEISGTDKIANKINKIPKGPWITKLQSRNVNLSDVGRGSEEVSLLLGADVAGRLLTGEKIELSSGPVAMNTHLGWTLIGKLPRNRERIRTLVVTTLHIQDMDIAKLWQLDAIGISDPAETKSRKEIEESAVNHFKSTVKRDVEGRYEVKLPWVEGHPPLPENKEVAEKRLRYTTAKLKTEGNLEKYDDLFKSWEETGIIEEVPQDQLGARSHYLPHRAVYKPESMTTPIRPVFDASCKTKGNPSLNDCNEKGPNLLELIPTVITRFRLRPVGIVADIKKAFQQISVAPEERNYLRFLWWHDLNCDKLKVYRHCRVVFGVSSSPFLLGATLNHLMDNAPAHLTGAATTLKSLLYVDNVAVSVQDLNEAQKFRADTDELLLPAKFDLRGWEIGPSEDDRDVPLLGLAWNLKGDSLVCDLKGFDKKVDGQITKRKISSLAHAVFDPIGHTAPFTITPKHLLQQAHILKLGWDTDLPDELKEKFQRWVDQVPMLSKVKIPRRITTADFKEQNSTNLHVFVDASKLAYSAAAFLRVDGQHGVSVQLILAKTRIAPLKQVTIPRLELMACLIGARLAVLIREILDCKEIQTVFWSDSGTALYWIKNSGGYGVFVQRRVNEMRTLTSSMEGTWRHVSSTLNPADLPSRGCSAESLLKSRWWE